MNPNLRRILIGITAWAGLGILLAFVIVFAWIVLQIFVQVACGAMT